MYFCSILQLFSLSLYAVESFYPINPPSRLSSSSTHSSSALEEFDSKKYAPPCRRDFCKLLGGYAATLPLSSNAETLRSEDTFRPAVRPTAYRVDSTQPPTLLPVWSAKEQTKILADIGKGKGTLKEAIVDDRVNLNNILNKAVYGTINRIESVAGRGDDQAVVSGLPSFLCMGMPSIPKALDIDLASGLIELTIRERKPGKTAIGLHFLPRQAQADVDLFLKSGDEQGLRRNLSSQHGISDELLSKYWPIFKLARTNRLALLALSPDEEQIGKLRTQGVMMANALGDSAGFNAMLEDPRYQLYVEKSLLKDFSDTGQTKSENFLLEKEFVHETAASISADWAIKNEDALVILVAPIQDLRFLQGINGRISRLCSFLSAQAKQITDDSVTTILLNPTANETLSKSKFLRLEIGTGPQNLDVQTKIADYLWFSSSPPVNLIPRLMNG